MNGRQVSEVFPAQREREILTLIGQQAYDHTPCYGATCNRVFWYSHTEGTCEAVPLSKRHIMKASSTLALYV
jgi:hypothetical protein